MEIKGSNNFHFLVYLSLLSVIGLLATDMYLPAFDVMHSDLATTKSNIGLSLTVFLGGYAVAQLLWGPFSDRFGIAKAVILGLGIFAISSIGLFLTDNIIIFILLRLLQAIGACSAAVSWQALVITHFKESETNKIFATIMPLVALSPALAPLLGVFILEIWGWRYIFIAVALIAVLLIIYSFSLPTSSKGDQTSNIKKSYWSFFSSKTYIGNVMIYGACFAGFFAWLTGAPFFLKDLGYSEWDIGLSFIPQTIAFMTGGYSYRFAGDKIKGRVLLNYLLPVYSLCMLAILYISLFSQPTLFVLLIPFCFMAFANGATYPIVVAEALKPFVNDSGKASALLNFLQLSACFLASAVVSKFTDSSSLLATSVVMAATIVFALTGYLLSKQPADQLSKSKL